MPTLTEPALKAYKSDPTKRREIADDLRRGLYFVIEQMPKTGRDEDAGRSWAIRYRSPVDRKPVKFRLGPYPVIGLAKARDMARANLENVAARRDPRAVKAATIRAEVQAKAEAEAQSKAEGDGTVDKAWTDYCLEHLPTMRDGSQKKYKQTFGRILPKWATLQAKSLTADDVENAIETAQKHGPHAANTCLTVVSSFLAWCADPKRRRRAYAIPSNPAANFDKPTEYVPRKHFLNDEEIPKFWAACDKIGNPFGPMFKLLLLTGCRRTELSLATWSEFDAKEKTLTIPADRAKNGREHIVYLSDEAVAIIEAMPRFAKCEWIFSTRGEHPSRNFSKAKANLEAYLVGVRAFRLHDLRKTFATGCASMAVPIPVTERMLNHASGEVSGIAAIYQLHDFAKEAKAAWQLWANRVRALIDAPRGKVLQFHKS